MIDTTGCSLEKTVSMIMKTVADGTALLCFAECVYEMKYGIWGPGMEEAWSFRGRI